MENRIKDHENDRYITTQDGDVYDRLRSRFVENIESINTYEKMPNDDSEELLLEFTYPAGSSYSTYTGTVIGHNFSLTFEQINTIRCALTALRQHQQDGGWLPIETLTDAEGDIILLNSARNLVLSMDAKRWRSTIGYPDHLHFHADYWKQINPPAPKKENDDA